MKRAHRCLALLLGLMVAITPAALAVPATAMTLHMAMSGDANSGDCCPGTNGDHSVCAMICANALSHATMPGQIEPVVLALQDDLWRPGALALPDHPHPPDLPPPKSVTLP